MEIKIDEKQVQDALDIQATEGIKRAFEGYTIKSTIEKTIADSVIPSLISEAVINAANQIDISSLTNHLASEIARSVTRGVQSIIRETMINIILDLQHIPSYETEKRNNKRMEISAKL